MQDGVRVENLEEVQKMLNNLAEKIDDVRPALNEAGQIVQNATEEAFENETSPWGVPWTPLSKSTQIQKEKKTPGRNMLYADGHMQESLYTVFGISGDYVEVGLNAKSEGGYPYAAVHQFGTKDGHIPARPFLPIDSNGDLERRVAEEILEVLEDHMEL